MSRKTTRVPEHLRATFSDDETQLRYDFTAQQMYRDLSIPRVSHSTLAELKFSNNKAFSLVVVFRAYRALLDRGQVSAKHSSGNHWVFINDLLPEAGKQAHKLSA